MSIDRSLKVASGLVRHRNVLTRAERVAKLSATGKFDPSAGDPLGLPKVASRKVVMGSKKKAKGEQAEAASS